MSDQEHAQSTASQPQTDQSPETAAEDGPIGTECSPPIVTATHLRLVLGAVLGGLIGTELIYKPMIGTLPIPMEWILIPAVVGAAIFFFLPSPNWTRAAVIDGPKLSLFRARHAETAMQSDEVLLIAGSKGISFAGGEMIAPQSVLLITTNGSFTLKVGPEVAAQVYALLSECCDHAAEIPFDGDVHIPESLNPEERESWLSDVRTLVDTSLGALTRQAWIGAAVALAITAASAIVSGVAIAGSSGGTSRGPAKLAIIAIIAFVAFLLLAAHASKLGARRRRILTALV